MKSGVHELEFLAGMRRNRHAVALKDDKAKFYVGMRNLASVHQAMRGVTMFSRCGVEVPSCEFYPMEAVRTNVLVLRIF